MWNYFYKYLSNSFLFYKMNDMVLISYTTTPKTFFIHNQLDNVSDK